jgi:hypothetical protein
MLVASLSAAAQDPLANAAPTETPKVVPGTAGIAASADEASTPEAKILAALEKRLDVEFHDTPLNAIVEFLRDKLQINISLNEAALAEEGVDPETRINLRARNIRPSSLLHFILRPRQLEWFVEDEVLEITTRVDADTRQTTKVYDVSGLIADQRRGEEIVDGLEYLGALIYEHTNGAFWQDVDGEGGVITPHQQGEKTVLVIRHSPQVQRQIASLLSALRAGNHNYGKQ